jgi:hypothetical protein
MVLFDTSLPAVVWRRVTQRYGYLSALGLYLVLALYLLARILPRFDQAIVGGPVAAIDGWQNVWNLWWIRYALGSPTNPFYTTLLFYPHGAPLYLQTLGFPNGLLTLPIQIVSGPIAAYNLAVILGLVGSGFGTYLLVLRQIRHHWIAVVCGAVFSYAPFHLTKVWDGQLEWITLQWLPLYAVVLFQALDTHRWSWSIGAGICLGLIALTSWYCALFSLVWTALIMIVQLPTIRQRRTWRLSLRTLLLIGGTTAILLAPVLYPALRGFQASTEWDAWTIANSADLLDFFIPSHLHPLWGAMIAEWSTTLRPSIFGQTITPGLGLVVLACIGGWSAWPQTRQGAIVLALLVLFALGPSLHIAGVDTGLPLPYTLLRWLPGATLARRPNHFIVFVLLHLVILAGWGMAALAGRGRRGKLVLSLLVICIGVEYFVLPFPPIVPVSGSTAALLRSTDGAIAEVPVFVESSVPLQDQIVHGRPIIGGFLARTPDEFFSFALTTPGLSQLAGLATDQRESDIMPDAVVPQIFAYYRIRTIMLRPTMLSPTQQQRAAAIIQRFWPNLAPQVVSDDRIIYDLPRLDSLRPFAYLGAGWDPVERDGDRVWRWFGATAEAKLINPRSTATFVTLDLDLAALDRERPLHLVLDGQPLTSFKVGVAGVRRQLQFVLPAGEHSLTLHSEVEQSAATGQRALSISVLRLALTELGAN